MGQSDSSDPQPGIVTDTQVMENFQFTQVMSLRFICQSVCILISVSFVLVEPGTKTVPLAKCTLDYHPCHMDMGLECNPVK